MRALTFLFIGLIFPAFAQVPSEIWEVTNNIAGNSEKVMHSTSDANGNVYATGYVSGTGSCNLFVTKHDSDGNLVFSDVYDSGSGSDWGMKISLDNSGNIFVVGNIRSTTCQGEGKATFTRKYNSSGTILWTNIYSSAIVTSHANDMKVLPSTGDVVITGYSVNQVTADQKNVMILKYLTDGTLDWSKSYDGGSAINDIGHKIRLDISGNVYVMSDVNFSFGAGTNLLLKYTSTGALSWSKITGVSGRYCVDIKNEGTNISVYDNEKKERYAKSSGLLNETVVFENATGLSLSEATYWRLSDGRYIRSRKSNFIKVYDNAGMELSSFGSSDYKDIEKDAANSLYYLYYSFDSLAVRKLRMNGDNYGSEFLYKFTPEDNFGQLELTPNNTFTVSTAETNVLLTHKACIPPKVDILLTGTDQFGNICPQDTVFFSTTSEYATAYSWFGENFGNNPDSMFIMYNTWPISGETTTIDNLQMQVDAGNGCIVDVDVPMFRGYRMIETYITDGFLGDCENDQGFLMSYTISDLYTYNWFKDGQQVVFDESYANEGYSFYLVDGNGSYELMLHDISTGCESIPYATIDISTIQSADDPGFYYDQSIYYTTGSDPTPIITGDMGGSFTEASGNVSIDGVTGVIDVSMSIVGGPYEIVYTTNGPCPDSTSFFITIENNSGIKELTSARLQLYPNPTKEFLNLECIHCDIKEVLVRDLNGKIVASFGADDKVDLTPLEPSIYNVEIVTELEILRKQVVKK